MRSARRGIVPAAFLVALLLTALPAAAQAPEPSPTDGLPADAGPVNAGPADAALAEKTGPSAPPRTPASSLTEAAGELTEAASVDGTADLDPAVIERVIQVLENDADRQKVLETLRTIAAVERPSTPEGSIVAEPMHWLQSEIDRRIAAVVSSIEAVLAAPNQIQFLIAWLKQQVTSEARRAFWIETLAQIALVVGVGFAVALALRRALRGWRGQFATYAPPTPLHFAVAIFLHATVRLVPVALFVAVAASIAWFLDLGSYTRDVTRSLVEGLAFVTAVTGVVRALLNYKNSHMNLFPVAAATGAEIQRRIVRVIAVGGYGYFGLQAARALGLPWMLHGFFEHVLFFATFLLYVGLILRFRTLGANGFRALAGEARSGLVGRFLPWATVAKLWHLFAIGFGLVVYLAWALDIAGGTVFLVRAMGLTAALLFLTRLVNVWLTERVLAGREGRALEEGEEAEVSDVITSAAQTPLAFTLRVVVTLLAFALILQAWGIDVGGWLASEAAGVLRDALLAAGLTLAIAYVLWKVSSTMIRNAIEETDHLGRPVRSNRSRTLLTIGRNFLFVIIWVTGGMLALGELGVNLAPLLAGAGVIGLAVGFGSQQLVQDIITGFFILVEDTIAVGDVADLGGKNGVVEAVSLRTVRLRAYDGQVHTIPYSTISTISNLTKDYSYYVFDVGVAYREDADRVMAVMAEVGAELQRDRAFRRLILQPLEIAGVDRFADSAVVIKARFKTRPLQQWTVGREYNRRLKRRFDELGIEIPFPQRTVHFAGAPEPAAASAPTPKFATSGAPDGLAINTPEGR